MLISVSEVAELFGVCTTTIRRWDKNGKLNSALRTMGNHRRYVMEEILNIINGTKEEEKLTVCYSRVSTSIQGDNLDRQAQVIKNYAIDNNYTNIKEIKDIGSGINYNKKGLLELIKLLLTNKVDTLILQYKDRLLRFGADIILHICKLKNIKVIFIEESTIKSKEENLIMDVISIITVFSARLSGCRSNKNKKLLATGVV